MPLTRDEDIAELLTNARTIAMIGASDRPNPAAMHRSCHRTSRCRQTASMSATGPRERGRNEQPYKGG